MDLALVAAAAGAVDGLRDRRGRLLQPAPKRSDLTQAAERSPGRKF